jgi:hypothetical protein
VRAAYRDITDARGDGAAAWCEGHVRKIRRTRRSYTRAGNPTGTE